MALETGDVDGASRCFDAAFSEAGTGTWLSGLLLGDRIRVALARGDLEQARSWQEQSLTEAHRIGAPRPIAAGSLGLARVIRFEGGGARAGPLLALAGEFHLTSGDLLGLAHVMVEAALLACQVDDWDTVAFTLAKVDAIRTSTGAGVPGVERADIEAATAAAAAALDHGAFEAATAQGRRAKPDDVLDRVLSSLSAS